MNLLKTRFIMLFIVAVSVPACASSNLSTGSYDLLTQHILDTSLAETSGLFCREGAFYTINDSGNAAKVYTLDSTGKIIHTSSDLGINRDWEAITGDDENLYIGEFGNNNGKRKDLSVIAVDKHDNTQKLAFSYANNQPNKNAAYAHDVDAEALTVKDGSLYLFSKSWRSGVANVFKLRTTQSNQDLTPIAQIDQLPGMITGADWDAQLKRFVIVGYSAGGFGVTSPFVAILNQDFTVLNVQKLRGFNQVEAVCSNGGDIWFTQEKNAFGAAKLVNIKLIKNN